MAIVIFCCSAAFLGFTNHRFILDTDDTYIKYRYAANIATGHGFVYNIGERVLGTTLPLFTLLLAAMGSSVLDKGEQMVRYFGCCVSVHPSFQAVICNMFCWRDLKR